MQLVALAALAGTSGAQQATEQEIRDSRRRLEQVQRERTTLRREMTQIRSRVQNLSTELTHIRREAGSSSEVLEEVEQQVQQRSEQIDATARDLLATRDRLGDRRAVLHHRLRSIYKRGALSSAQVLMTADSFGDLINRYKYLVLVARHDRLLVREVAALEIELVSRERLLQRTLTQLRDEHTERAIQYEQLTRLEAQRRAALSTATSREREAARRLARLESDERSLRTLLVALERRRTTTARAGGSAATRSASASALTTSDLGALAWPVQGNLLYRFGRAEQPNGTSIRWNGIGIGAAAGAPVRAVESGTVVLAGPFEGYGPTVVVSHGGGYYSLYLYLRDLSVRDGDSITRNQVVGTVGGTDTPEGAHIEFQIRAPGGAAIDPLSWLRKRAGT